jgi:hypothetical protein
MFTIEFVVVHRPAPKIIEETEFAGASLTDADDCARSQLADVRRRRPAMLPDGYQIRNGLGKVVLCSWRFARR